MRKYVGFLASAGFAVLPAVSHAATPTLTDVLGASGIDASGYVDASFAYSNRTTTPGAFTGTVDSFTLNQVALTLAKLPTEGFGGVVNVIGGQDASKLNNFGGGSDFNLNQAYVQYASGAFTAIGGKFTTLAGSEVINSTQNSNATRSLLFNLQPLTLTGVRGAYKFSDMVTVYGGLVNAAGGATQDNNKQKTVEASVALTPVSGLTVALTDYYGNEGASGDKTNLLDLVASYAIGDLSLGLNADYSKNDVAATSITTKNTGTALYANYQVTKEFRASVRGEYVKTQTTGAADTTAKEVTLTGAYAVAKNFDVLGELRYDKNSAAGAFVDSSGAAKDSQTALIAKALYKF